MDEYIESLVLWFDERDISINVASNDEISFFYHGLSYCSDTESTGRITVKDFFKLLKNGKELDTIKNGILKQLNDANTKLEEYRKEIRNVQIENRKLKESIKIVKE